MSRKKTPWTLPRTTTRRRIEPAQLILVVVFVVAGDLGHLAAVELGDGDRRRLDRDAGKLAVAAVGDRVVGRRRDEDQVALTSSSWVSPATDIRPAAANDDVDLLGLLVGVQRLLDAGGDLEPGHGHVPRAELPGVHEDVGAEAVPLLDSRLAEPPDKHGGLLAEVARLLAVVIARRG